MITEEMIEVGYRASLFASKGEVRKILTAVLEASPAGVVKPLEWVEHWGGADDDLPSWRGKNPLGLHVSVDFIGKYKLDRHSDAPQDELEAAKSAAFADYSARIMSAIEPAGVGVQTPPPSTHVVPQSFDEIVENCLRIWFFNYDETADNSAYRVAMREIVRFVQSGSAAATTDLLAALKLAKEHAELEDEILDIVDDAIDKAEGRNP